MFRLVRTWRIYRCGSRESRRVPVTVSAYQARAARQTYYLHAESARRWMRRLVEFDALESRFRAKYFKVAGVGVPTHKLPESLTAPQHLTSA
jgi:hypothetical protein